MGRSSYGKTGKLLAGTSLLFPAMIGWVAWFGSAPLVGGIVAAGDSPAGQVSPSDFGLLPTLIPRTTYAGARGACDSWTDAEFDSLVIRIRIWRDAFISEAETSVQAAMACDIACNVSGITYDEFLTCYGICTNCSYAVVDYVFAPANNSGVTPCHFRTPSDCKACGPRSTDGPWEDRNGGGLSD